MQHEKKVSLYYLTCKELTHTISIKKYIYHLKSYKHLAFKVLQLYKKYFNLILSGFDNSPRYYIFVVIFIQNFKNHY